MLLCPTAWGWGKPSVPCRVCLQVAAVNSEERSSKVTQFTPKEYPFLPMKWAQGHTRTGLTHLCLLDLFMNVQNVQHLVGPGTWRPTGFCAGPSLWKLHSDTIFLSGISQCSLSSLIFISELLGFWAIAFFQHGEPQSALLHPLKERHSHSRSPLVATAPCSWSLNWFKETSINAWESEKRWPHCQRISRLAPWVKDICQQLLLEQCYGSTNIPAFYSYINIRNQ